VPACQYFPKTPRQVASAELFWPIFMSCTDDRLTEKTHQKILVKKNFGGILQIFAKLVE
jgi:hypothetical protein